MRFLTGMISGSESELPDNKLIAFWASSAFGSFLCAIVAWLIIILVQYDWFLKDSLKLIKHKNMVKKKINQNMNPQNWDRGRPRVKGVVSNSL